MNIVVLIPDQNGQAREAIPVRAIPYVTGWRSPCGISPDVLVSCLGRRPNAKTQSDPLRTTSAYKLCSGLPVLVRPDEWNILAAQLAGLSKDLKKQFPADIDGRRDDHGYAVWQVRSIEAVPPATFVWLDEFRSDFQRYFDFRARVSSPEFLGDRELNLAPLLLSETVRKVVMEGFASPPTMGTDAKPWLVPDAADPPAEYSWYTPARYFARQLVVDDTTLLTKKETLAGKVSASLKGVGILKRGGQRPYDPATVLKAFVNVNLR